MLFNLVFANDTFLSCFFVFFLMIDLHVLISAFNAQIFSPFSELVTPIGIPTKEVKGEIEIHPVNVEAKMEKCSI